MEEERDSKKEYELRRAEKKNQNSVSASTSVFGLKKMLSTIGVVCVIISVIWLAKIAVTGSSPSGPDFSREVPIDGREHVPAGQKPTYSTNPPASGPHYPLTARKKFYDVEVPDEYIVHNLEHGDVWISYKPSLSDENKEALKKLLFNKVIITPRTANETDIAISSWGRLDTFNLEDGHLPTDRITDYIKRYRDLGPEKIPAGATEETFN